MNRLTHLALRAASLGDDLRQIAPAAQALGCRGVQLDLQLGMLDLSSLTASGRREVRHLLSRHDLELSSLRVQLGVESLAQGGDFDRVIWTLKKAVDAAAGLAAPMICLDLGRLPAAGESRPVRKPIPASQAGLIIIPGQELIPEEPPTDEPLNEAEWGPVDAVLHEVGSLADRASMTLALASELSSYASLKRAIEHARCTWLGVDLDPVSLLRDRWDTERVLDAAGGLVRHVRVRDALKGSGGRTQPAPVGRGSTHWGQLLALLDEGGFSGWMTIDTTDLPDRRAEAARAVAALRAAGQ